MLTTIDRTVVEAPDFTTDSSDIELSIPLSSGETIQFIAEAEFFTPRHIATNRSDILGIPITELVDRTANNIPVVKMPIGAVVVTGSQYYATSVVRDMYQIVPIDTFFTELTNDLEIPIDESLQNQRDSAMRSVLALDDLNAALALGDIDAVNEANAAIDEELASSINAEEPDPAAILSLEEADELAALDLVGLTTSTGGTDGAADIIDPTPEIDPSDLIQKIPNVPGKIKGTDTINRAINLLNAGIQEVEETTQTGVDEEGKCKFMVVAKGKKGFLGVGKKSERKVSRKDTEDKLKKLNEEIAKQEATDAALPGYRKMKTAKSTAGFLLKGVGTFAVFAASVAVAGPFAIAGAAVLSSKSSKTIPMTKQEILILLNRSKSNLETILNKDC